MTHQPRRFVASETDSAVVVAETLADLIRPPERMTVSQWAERYRRLSPKASSKPGRWRNETAPYLVKIMDCMGVDHPCRTVTVGAAAQTGKSEASLNAAGHMIHLDPRPALALMPNRDVATSWQDEKFGLMVEATPELRLRILGDRSRGDGKGSTTTRKKYRGGTLDILHAGSSKGLQMKSKGWALIEELAEIPLEAGERGDPVRQVEKRLLSYGDRAKLIKVSTFGIEGTCRTDMDLRSGTYEHLASPCPECGWYFVIEIEHMAWHEGRAIVNCPHCAAKIEEASKAEIRRRSDWILCYRSADPNAPKPEPGVELEPPENPDNPRPPDCFPPEEFDRWRLRDDEGRDPSFRYWQVISPFVAWADILKERDQAEDDPARFRKAFFQQTIARPYEEASSAPRHEELAALAAEHGHERGVVPPGYCMLTIGVDVQANRLEWACYAWGPMRRGACIDHGVIAGVPEDNDTWAGLWRVLAREWPGVSTIDLAIDGAAIDSGYRTPHVYKFTSSLPGVWAVKGTADPEHPPIGAPTRQKAVVGARYWHANLFNVGVYRLKHRVYEGLHAWSREVETGKLQSGAIAYHREFDAVAFRQLTAETLSLKKLDRKGRPVWLKGAFQQNEQLDLCVYAMARAAAEGLLTKSHDDWRALFDVRAQAGERPPPLLDAMTGAPKPDKPKRPPKPKRAGGAMPEFMRRLGAANREE